MSEYYYIVSQLSGLALDVEDGNTSPGARVSMWQKNFTKSQMWIDDPATSTIRSRLNGYCLDAKGGVLAINPYRKGCEFQIWKRQGDYIFSGSGRNYVLDISGRDKSPRAKVILYELNSGWNQKWSYEMSGEKKA